MEGNENINNCNVKKNGEDSDFSLTNFSTPKNQSINALRGKEKGSTEALANVTRQNTKKQSVEEIFLSHTPGPAKATHCFQQPTINHSFHAIQKEEKVMSVLEAEVKKIK